MIVEKQQMKNYSKGGEEARSKGCRPPILQEVHLPLHQEAGGQHVDDVIDGDDACNDGYFEDWGDIDRKPVDKILIM